jgi:hypothetical protein
VSLPAQQSASFPAQPSTSFPAACQYQVSYLLTKNVPLSAIVKRPVLWINISSLGRLVGTIDGVTNIHAEHQHEPRQYLKSQ